MTPTVKVKCIRTIPGVAKPGDVLDMTVGEARLKIRDGKVVPHAESGPEKLDNKAITEGMTRGDRN